MVWCAPNQWRFSSETNFEFLPPPTKRTRETNCYIWKYWICQNLRGITLNTPPPSLLGIVDFLGKYNFFHTKSSISALYKCKSVCYQFESSLFYFFTYVYLIVKWQSGLSYPQKRYKTSVGPTDFEFCRKLSTPCSFIIVSLDNIQKLGWVVFLLRSK